MLFMVIEHFRGGDFQRVGERFRRTGRMLPQGVTYHASWVDSVNARCFQVMKATDQEALKPWLDAWNDLVDFEVIPIETSAEFWRRIQEPK